MSCLDFGICAIDGELGVKGKAEDDWLRRRTSDIPTICTIRQPTPRAWKQASNDPPIGIGRETAGAVGMSKLPRRWQTHRRLYFKRIDCGRQCIDFSHKDLFYRNPTE